MNIKDKNISALPENANPDISSNAVYQQTLADAFAANSQQPQAQNQQQPALSVEEQIKQAAIKEIQVIENLINSGVVSSEQGQNLMNYVVNKAYTLVQQQKTGQATQTAGNDFSADSYLNHIDNPEFFQQEGRNQVLQYLKNSYPSVGKDELSQIINMITGVENSAVKRYLRKQEHEKTLKNANEAAKQRLIANAQKTAAGNGNGVIFTREQIGKMSGAEFAKNERLIMDQLKRGLIR